AQMVKTEAEFKNMIEQRVKKVEEISNSLQQRKESADKELEHSDTLFTSLINSIKERQTEVKEAILKEQRSAETRAEQLTQDLNREIQELETRRQELEELRESDDHLQLIQRFPSVTVPPVSTDWSEVRLPSEQSAATLRDALSKLKETVDKQMDLLRNQGKTPQEGGGHLVDVELDPHTAHPNIVLSPDGKQAGRGELLHIVPDNPQRFDPVICVLAKKGYVSGRFYFQ
ncbi:hypothetical protein NL108_009645, partial [Boleophthalmus pectinirostris]